MGRPIKTHTGEVFGRLTVIGEGYNTAKVRFVECRCECGNQITANYSNLGKGTVSCGCYRKEFMEKQRQPTHGMTKTPEYSSWMNMRTRCQDTSAINYHLYGGRGIRVCERWKSFQRFIEDMGRRPSSRHSIERKNNNGDYTPDNCVWATKEEQGRNKRNNRILTVKGESKPLVVWAQECGIKESMIQERLRRGWNEEDAVLIPKLSSGISHIS